ncbi:hypothetical protein H3N56_02635 [Cetobacterium sp. 2A]|nr:hypothetical protein [Cetobacterium sp. 2A]
MNPKVFKVIKVIKFIFKEFYFFISIKTKNNWFVYFKENFSIRINHLIKSEN